MATLAQIKKVAKSNFIPEMKARGFSENSKASMTFFREAKDDIYHIINFYILRSGENLRLHVYAWVPEIEEPEYDEKKFPKGLSMTTGYQLREDGVGIGGKHWDISSLDSIPCVLDEILIDVDKIAIPWLDKIDSREEFINHVTRDYQRNPNFPKLKEAILNKASSSN